MSYIKEISVFVSLYSYFRMSRCMPSEILDLDKNELTGTIPDKISSLKYLRKFPMLDWMNSNMFSR